MINAYKILGLRNFATRREVLIAYRNLSKKYHPDLNQGDKFYEEKFKEIQAAYTMLTDFGQHMELDTFLRQQIEDEKSTDESPVSAEPLQDKQPQQTKSPSKGAKIKQSSYPGKQYLKTALYAFVALCITGIAVFLLIDYKKSGSDFITESDSKTNSNFPLELEAPIQNDSVNLSAITINNYVESKNCFLINSTKEEVIKIQGKPTDSVKVSALKQEIWYYDLSSVTFENNHVCEYANTGDNLQVSYFKPALNTASKSTFSIGSTRMDVIAVQGNPTTTMLIKPLNQEIWYYGKSRISFEKGRVREYTNSQRNLKTSYSNTNRTNATML